MTDPALPRDHLHRFSFDHSNVRGMLVQLDQTCRDALAHHHYPPPVANLLGQFLAAARLLSGTIKWRGRLILQARSQGEIPLIMAEADSDGGLRAIARGAQGAMSDDFHQLLQDGQLAITIEPERGQRYQGLVPLEGDNLAACLESYFLRSEQLATGLWLAATADSACGLLLQELPARQGEQRQWEHLYQLAATVQPAELLELPAGTLLHRLFHQEPLRLLQSNPCRFSCSCSRERSERTLRLLGEKEAESILAERGEVQMSCEFCGRQYQFDAAAVRALFRTAH